MWFKPDDCNLAAINVVTFSDILVWGAPIVANNLVEKWPMIAARRPDDCSSLHIRIDDRHSHEGALEGL